MKKLKHSLTGIKKSGLYRKFKKLIPTIILMIVVSLSSFLVGKKVGLNTDTSSTNTKIEEVTVEKHTISKTLTSSGEIEAKTTKKLSLSTSYYFSSLCVEEDDLVKKGANLLQYTNGKYLTAPYDLVVTKINVPSAKKKATSSHYIKVARVDRLLVSIDVNESEISNIHVGDQAEIVLTADSSKTYTGKISKISPVASYSSSGSTFPTEISLKNDGNMKIGMSASCTIKIKELKDVIAVPISAVQINGSKRYVVVVDHNQEKEVAVTTGLSDDEYVEIKQGLSGGETIKVVTITKENTYRSQSRSGRNGNFPGRGNMPSNGNSGGFPPNMPNGSNRQGYPNNQTSGQGNG